MDVFQDVGPDYSVQISVHKVEHQVDISIVFSSHHILEANDVLVPSQLLQENDLTEGSLGVCCVLESIEILLQSHDFLSTLINSFPHNTISSLAYTRITIRIDLPSFWRISYFLRTCASISSVILNNYLNLI